METVNTKMGPFEWLLLLILSVLWGGSFFFVGIAVKALPPLTIVVLQVGLAAIALNLIVRATGLRMPKEWRYWKAFLGMGLICFGLAWLQLMGGPSHFSRKRCFPQRLLQRGWINVKSI